MNRFSGHLQVVNTNNYKKIAASHTTNHSTLSPQPAFTSRCSVTALNNGYSSAVFHWTFLGNES
jgi:hypothetical protein